MLRTSSDNNIYIHIGWVQTHNTDSTVLYRYIQNLKKYSSGFTNYDSNTRIEYLTGSINCERIPGL